MTVRATENQGERLFKQLVTRFGADPRVSLGTGFGTSPGLRVGSKVFAMLIKGDLVLKLPKERVDQIIASGGGAPFDPGHGRLMKEWVTIPVGHSREWKKLGSEAIEFVGRAGSRRGG
ncbi:MAG: hypothetical protein ACRD1T_07785 [Acidimicrobiia bacterium]